MSSKTKFVVWTKNVKKDKSVFKVHKCCLIRDDGTRAKIVDCVISNDLKEKLRKDKLSFPIIFDLYNEDFFIKKEKYTTKDGVEGEKIKVIIMDYFGAQETEFKNENDTSVLE